MASGAGAVAVATLALAGVLLPLAAVAWAAGGLTLSPADVAALRFTVLQAALSAGLSVALAVRWRARWRGGGSRGGGR